MDTLAISDIPTDAVRRITVAADQLYEESGKSAFPNVDAVRRRARVNMNDASSVMRAWRRSQTAAASPVTVAIPSTVQTTSNALLSEVWNTAVNSANASLQAAQTAWELERADAEACRQQLASAFDQQVEEHAASLETIETLQHQLRQRDASQAHFNARVDTLAQNTQAAEVRAFSAETRANEIQKRADDLKAELTLAHANAGQERADATRRLDCADSTIKDLNEQLRQRSDDDNRAREELTRLRGRLEAITAEYHALLGRLTQQPAQPKPAKRNPAPRPKPTADN